MRRLLVAVAALLLGVSGAWRPAAAQEQTTPATAATSSADPAAASEPKPEPPRDGPNTSTTLFRDPAEDLLPNPGAYPYDAENPTDTGPPEGPSGGAHPRNLEQYGSGEDDGWGWGGIWGPVRRVIDGWFLSLAEAALKPLLDLLSTTMFATPDVTAPGTVRDYWVYSLVIGDTVLVLVIVIAGLVLMGHESVQTRTTIKEVAPRIAFAVVAAHASLGFSGMLIRAANALSAGFLGDFDPKSGHAATEGLIHVVLGVIAGGNIFLAILGIAVAALGIGVLCTYIARVANIVVLVGAAPLFLVAHAVPQLDGAARLWWRNLVGCLGVQVGQALVMSAALRVFFHDDGRSLAGMPGGGTMDLLLVGSLFWLMLRIPSYAGRLIFAPRPTNSVTRQLGQGAVSQGIGALTKAAA